jgi:hypothetical protein
MSPLLLLLLAAASISGTVRQGEPGMLVNVVAIDFQYTDLGMQNLPGSPKTAQSAITPEGRYSLADLPPGTYRVYVRRELHGIPLASRIVRLSAGQDLTGIDFSLPVEAAVSGKVLDENGEPLSNITVRLVQRLYQQGVLRYVNRFSTLTNDKGEYRVQGAIPGLSYLLMAEKFEKSLNPMSDAPADLKKRRPSVIPIYFPGSPDPAGGAPIVLASGEHREFMNLRLKKAPGFCVDGRLEANGEPSALAFQLNSEAVDLQGKGTSPWRSIQSGADGKFRLCDLHPGQYRIQTSRFGGAVSGIPTAGNGPRLEVAGEALVVIGKEDIHGLKVNATAPFPLAVEAVLDGDAPPQPLNRRVDVKLSPVAQGSGGSGKPLIPGRIELTNLGIADYFVAAGLARDSLEDEPSRLYVKDVTYAGVSVLRQPLRLGTAMGNAGLLVTMAQDGAVVTATVSDKDGNPIPDAAISIIPSGTPSESALPVFAIFGSADQNGSYTSLPLAPGKYLVLATANAFPLTPEGMAALWSLRSHATQADLGPKAAVRVTLTPVR